MKILKSNEKVKTLRQNKEKPTKGTGLALLYKMGSLSGGWAMLLVVVIMPMPRP